MALAGLTGSLLARNDELEAADQPAVVLRRGACISATIVDESTPERNAPSGEAGQQPQILALLYCSFYILESFICSRLLVGA